MPNGGYAAENDAIADRLDAAGHTNIAAVYRDTACEHADCAGRLAGTDKQLAETQ